MEKLRHLVIASVLAILLLFASIAAGLRINGTHSLPLGFYWVVGKRAQKGDLVFINLPRTPIFAMAKERGYLDIAFSPAQHLLKRLVAVEGDRVKIDSSGVEVNGILLANSTPRNCDDAGRPLRPFFLKDHILTPGEILLMSDYSPASFDSRYFGPLQSTTIEAVVAPLLTWN